MKKDLRQFFTYAIGSMAQTALIVLLLPLYLNRLSTSDYGIVSVLLTINTILTPIAGAGVTSGVGRIYYEHEPQNRQAIAGTMLIWMGSSALLFLILMSLVASGLSQGLFGTADYAPAIRLSGAILWVTALQGACYMLLRLEKHAGAFLGISLSGFVTEIALKVLFMGVLHQGIQGYLLSSLLAISLTVLLSFIFLRRTLVLSLRYDLLRELLALSYPFIFADLGMWLLTITGQFTLNLYVGQAPVGIYTLGSKFATIFNIVLLGPLVLFWNPFLFSQSAKHGPEVIGKLIAQVLPLLALGCSILWIGLTAGASDLIRAMASDPNYLNAGSIIPYLALAPFMFTLVYPLGSAILQAKQTHYTSYAMIAATLFNLILNLILVPTFSFYGATAATVAGYLLYCVLQLYWTHKVFPMSYNWKRLLRIFASTAIAGIAVSGIHLPSAIPSFLVREAVGYGLFAALIWTLGGVRLHDFELLRRLLKNSPAST